MTKAQVQKKRYTFFIVLVLLVVSFILISPYSNFSPYHSSRAQFSKQTTYQGELILQLSNEISDEDLEFVKNSTGWDDVEYEYLGLNTYRIYSPTDSFLNTDNYFEEVLSQINQGYITYDSVPGVSSEDGVQKLAAEHINSKMNAFKFDDIRSSFSIQSTKINVIEPNYIYTIDVYETDPNDSSYRELWGLKNTGQGGGTFDFDIDAEEGWQTSTGSTETIVAVLDTGVDYRHPDLGGCLGPSCKVVRYYSAVNEGGLDSVGHGTHVAGTIAAVGNNSQGVVGVCPDCKIMAIKGLGQNGGSSSDLITGFNYAINNGANVINNSWGGGGYSRAWQNIINTATNKGIVVVASAGNDNSSRANYPASYSNVISVGSTHKRAGRSSFSSYGRTVDVSAPGSSILSTIPGGRYTYFDGTSMSSPHVSGVVGVLHGYRKSRGLEFNHNVIDSLLKKTAVKFNADRDIGEGHVNLKAALEESGGTRPPVNPTPTSIAPPIPPNPPTNPKPTVIPTPLPTKTPTPKPTPNPIPGDCIGAIINPENGNQIDPLPEFDITTIAPEITPDHRRGRRPRGCPWYYILTISDTHHDILMNRPWWRRRFYVTKFLSPRTNTVKINRWDFNFRRWFFGRPIRVRQLPSGQTVHVRLRTIQYGKWVWEDYQFVVK